MQIEHSDLFNEFISFWFDTSVDCRHEYTTMLDYITDEWITDSIVKNEEFLKGVITSTKDENAELMRIKNLVTEEIQKKHIKAGEASVLVALLLPPMPPFSVG